MARLLALLVVIAAAIGIGWTLLAPRGPEVLVLDAAAQPVAGAPGQLAVTMTLQNDGGPLVLTGVRSTEAASAHMMGAKGALAIPGQDSALLAADGAHLMLDGVRGDLSEGRLIPFELEFGAAGNVSGKARLAAPAAGGGMHDMHGMGETIDLPASEAPAVTLTAVQKDGGWEVTIATERFEIREVPDGTPHVPGEGHGHLYLNGLKLGRLYGPVATIGALPPGEHLIEVTLNSHDHREYSADGWPVGASVRVTVP